MQTHRRAGWAVLGAAVFLYHTPAFANIGMPLLAPPGPELVLLFIPVVALETWIIRRLLGASRKRTLLAVVLANLVTTAIGVFLASHEISRHTLPPLEWRRHWNYPVAKLVNLVPAFFVSWLVEYFVAWPLLGRSGPKPLCGAMLRANLASYGLLALILVVLLWF